MPRSVLACWLLGFVVSLPAFAGDGTDAKKSPAGPRDSKLVIGDRYAIDIESNEVQQSVSGDLVQFTEQWIVLRRVLERREITSKSSERMAYLTKLFSKEDVKKGKRRLNEDLWIPRTSATITGHARAAHRRTERVKASKVPTTPALGRTVCVELAGEGNINEHMGALVTVSPQGIEISRQRRVAVQEVVPVVGELPVVGTAFRRTRFETRQVKEKIGLEHLLCLRILPEAGDETSVELSHDRD